MSLHLHVLSLGILVEFLQIYTAFDLFKIGNKSKEKENAHTCKVSYKKAMVPMCRLAQDDSRFREPVNKYEESFCPYVMLLIYATFQFCSAAL